MVFMATFYNDVGFVVRRVRYSNYKSFSQVFNRVCSMVDNIAYIDHFTLEQIW